jgi:localization factor PodJL
MPAPATALGNPAPVADRRPIDPSLPPDHPLEPGSGAGRGRGGHSPADRIAASEAALGPSRPPVIPDPEAKANFIAAARRAAQAANNAAAGRNDSPEQAPRSPRLDAESTNQVPSHIKSLAVGTSLLLIILGSVQLLTGSFSRSGNPLPAPLEEAARTAPVDSTATLSAAEATPSLPDPPSRQSSLVPGGVSFPPPTVDTIADVIVAGAANTPPAAATSRSPDPAERLITGSIPAPSIASTATQAASAPSSPPARPSGADKLPAGIGNAALRTAAIKGDAAAEFEVAVRFAEGRGTPQDFSVAADWFERAARQGVAPAQFRLAGLYEKGIGVKKDLDRARRLYLAAAQAGNARAMHNLAVLYAESIDGKPDYQIAVKWFRQAAEHGVADSQYNLGVLYARGIGVEANLAEAFKWFSLAAREGDRESTRKRDEVAARLDHATVMAARAAVQAWTAQPQPEAATQVRAAGGWDSAPAAATAKRRGRSDAKVPRSTQ